LANKIEVAFRRHGKNKARNVIDDQA